MKATDLLKKQHREVRALFKKALKTSQAGERRRLMDEITHQIKMHTQLEEQIFYPAMREAGTRKATQMVDEALEEHHVVDLVLAELPRIEADHERFEAKMTVLHELVEHHVEEEEHAMFRQAERLGRDELRELGERMQAMLKESGGARKAA